MTEFAGHGLGEGEAPNGGRTPIGASVPLAGGALPPVDQVDVDGLYRAGLELASRRGERSRVWELVQMRADQLNVPVMEILPWYQRQREMVMALDRVGIEPAQVANLEAAGVFRRETTVAEHKSPLDGILPALLVLELKIRRGDILVAEQVLRDADGILSGTGALGGPCDGVASYLYGVAADRLGHPETALGFWQSALRDQNFRAIGGSALVGELLQAQAELLLRQRRLPEALESAQRALVERRGEANLSPELNHARRIAELDFFRRADPSTALPACEEYQRWLQRPTAPADSRAQAVLEVKLVQLRAMVALHRVDKISLGEVLNYSHALCTEALIVGDQVGAQGQVYRDIVLPVEILRLPLLQELFSGPNDSGAHPAWRALGAATRHVETGELQHDLRAWNLLCEGALSLLVNEPPSALHREIAQTILSRFSTLMRSAQSSELHIPRALSYLLEMHLSTTTDGMIGWTGAAATEMELVLAQYPSHQEAIGLYGSAQLSRIEKHFEQANDYSETNLYDKRTGCVREAHSSALHVLRWSCLQHLGRRRLEQFRSALNEALGQSWFAQRVAQFEGPLSNAHKNVFPRLLGSVNLELAGPLS